MSHEYVNEILKIASCGKKHNSKSKLKKKTKKKESEKKAFLSDILKMARENYDEEEGSVPGEQKRGRKKYGTPKKYKGPDKKIVRSAVQDVMTDKFQVDDVLPKVPEKLRDNVLNTLRKKKQN